MAKQTRENYGKTPEEVLEAWQTSNTAQEAADKLGMPIEVLYARISKYRTEFRAAGAEHRIKKMKRGPSKKKLNISALIEFVKRLDERKEQKTTPKKKASILV